MTDEVTELLLEPCHGELHGDACARAAGPGAREMLDGDVDHNKADRPAASRRRSLGCWAPAEGFSRSSHAEAAALAGEGSTRGARVGEMEVDGPGGVGEEEKEARGRALRLEEGHYISWRGGKMASVGRCPHRQAKELRAARVTSAPATR